MKRYTAVFLAMVMTIALVGCGPAGSEGAPAATTGAGATASGGGNGSAEPIKIGVFETFTGGAAAYGEYEFRGMEMAQEAYPELNGRPIEFVKVDNKSDPVEAATAAERLCTKENVALVLGSWSSALCLSAGPVFMKHEVPAIAAAATNVNVTLGNPYYYRVCYLDSFQAPACATYTCRDLGYKTFGVIYEITNDAAVAQYKFFEDTVEKLGGTVVGVTSFSMGDQDFNSQLQAILANKPDIIFSPGNFTEVALMIKQARVMGDKTPFIATDGLDVPEFTKVGGTDVDGTMCSTFFDSAAPINDMSKKFSEQYKKKYNTDEVPVQAALAYDTYLAAYEALKATNGSTDGPTLKAALDKVKFEGCTGSISFDENGDAIKDSLVVKVVENGVWTFKAVFKK